ncbi:hypothetical protein SFR_3444 [Streptomyces sp. FR-008]|nr:hypothetical protein SFR_3444 [Streptomyces sp. FR-008]
MHPTGSHRSALPSLYPNFQVVRRPPEIRAVLKSG